MTITVRRATPKDAAAFARIMGDPAVYPGLMQLPYTNENLWAARLADNDQPDKPGLVLVAELNGEVVGNAGLHPVVTALRRRHAALLGMSVAPNAQRQGVGGALMTALCDYADRWAGVLRLELTVYTDNAAALRLYQRHGFVIEGTLRGYSMRDGQYADVYTMARFHPNPPQLPPQLQPQVPPLTAPSAP
jgi:putative acetyltransferase